MLNQSEFLAKTSERHQLVEYRALQNIVLAHAAAVFPSYDYLKEHFYKETRKLLNCLEENDSTGLTTLNTLQAFILLTLYELKQLKFARAWTSVCRVMWLCQMLGLHKMDPKEPHNVNLGSKYYLPETHNAQALEERRAAFWGAFTLNCFVGTGIGWTPTCNVNIRDVGHLLFGTLLPINLLTAFLFFRSVRFYQKTRDLLPAFSLWTTR
jgi:hypothetical protein